MDQLKEYKTQPNDWSQPIDTPSIVVQLLYYTYRQDKTSCESSTRQEVFIWKNISESKAM